MKNRILSICIIGMISWFRIAGQEQVTNLPVFYITTENGKAVTGKDVYVPGYLTVKSSDPDEELSIVTEIRKRGNSTLHMPKPPFRIKLDKKTNLLNLPARAKSWVLLANYADKTLIRNALACKISEELSGIEFTPSVRFVDVILNGDYLGNYMLTDQMEVREGRVPVEEHTTGNITGGYLVEIDGFAGSEPLWFNTARGVPVTIKYPKYDEISTEEKNYITNFTKAFENLMFSANFTDPEKGYRSMVDQNSLIDWYVACELTGNSDAFWSVYLYKYRDKDKLYFGPLWDFDIAFNNDQRLGDATRKLMRESAHDYKTWIRRLWQDDWFKETVRKRWIELIYWNNLEGTLLHYMDSLATGIDASQRKNFERWPVLNTRVYNEVYLFSTYQEGVDYLSAYLRDRITFLSESFTTSLSSPFPEFSPEENTTYCMANIRTRNRMTVQEEGHIALWNPVPEDQSQQWLFRSLGENTYYIVHASSGLVLTGSGREESLFLSSADAGNKKQAWKIIPVRNGVYGIVNQHSGYSVNNSAGSYENGTPAIEYDNRITESLNQQWVITESPQEEDTGTPVISREENIHVYPNPASDKIYIRFPSSSEGTTLTIAVFAIDGKCVYRFTEINNPQKEGIVPVGSMPVTSGIYILKVTAGERTWTEKLIIRKD